MKKSKIALFIIFLAIASIIHAQTNSPDAISSDWETVSLGKLQKKPRFKEPMISVKFISEEGVQYMQLSLKYMFTDAVFDEAVPVEYYKNEKIQFVTETGKNELRATRYAKARRMNSIAQKTADIKVIFAGDMSFLENSLVRNFTVHYAQGYQDINLNSQEAIHLRDAYIKFITSLPKTKQTKKTNVKIEGEAPQSVKPDTVQSSQNSLDILRKQAKRWGK